MNQYTLKAVLLIFTALLLLVFYLCNEQEKDRS